MATTLIEVTNLTVAYGGIQAVKGVSLEVRSGELVSLIGANGAGKTTTLKAITGIQPVADGEVMFMDRAIKGHGAWNLVKQGLVMVPEGRGVFTWPRVLGEESQAQFGVEVSGRSTELVEEFFAISVERRISHPAARVVSEAARSGLFIAAAPLSG